MTHGICHFEDCDRYGYLARGLCTGHYKQQLKGQPLRPLMQRAERGSLLPWLLEAIQRQTDDCIEWPFGKSYGYGKITIDGRQTMAHSVALNYANPWHPPYGKHALHACDNPGCVNPRHLSWGTQTENVRQMWERGRGWTQVRGL